MNLLLLILAVTTLHKQLVVEADFADSDGDTIVLQGNVHIDHDLGKVHAGEARFRKHEQPEAPLPSHETELHEGVTLDFVDAGTLTCCDAYLATQAMQARFQGSVDYSDASIDFHCDRMDVLLHRASDKEEELAQKQVTPIKDKLKSISAFGNVSIHYDEAFTAQADEAHYVRQPTSRELPDQLRLRYNPAALKRTEMPCDLVHLGKKIEMDQHELGTLKTQGEVWVTRTLINGKPTIDLLCCIGETILATNTAERRTLFCHGTLSVDSATHQAILEKPPGATSEEKQVHYIDPLGGIQADRVVIDYIVAPEGYQLDRVVLTGHVKIRNGDPDATGALALQYALADRVEYDPWSEQMTLTALGPRRVLFLDASEDTKISASGVIIKRNENTIQGIGGVRFTLNDIEIGQLRENFGL